MKRKGMKNHRRKLEALWARALRALVAQAALVHYKSDEDIPVTADEFLDFWAPGMEAEKVEKLGDWPSVVLRNVKFTRDRGIRVAKQRFFAGKWRAIGFFAGHYDFVFKK